MVFDKRMVTEFSAIHMFGNVFGDCVVGNNSALSLGLLYYETHHRRILCHSLIVRYFVPCVSHFFGDFGFGFFKIPTVWIFEIFAFSVSTTCLRNTQQNLTDSRLGGDQGVGN